MKEFADSFAALALISVLHLVSSYEWSDWSQWSPCNVKCGDGVHQRSRKCLVDICTELDTDYKLCQFKECTGITNFRRRQCVQQRSAVVSDTLYKWEVFYDHTEPCTAFCVDKTTRTKLKVKEIVPDGVRCSNDSNNVCIKGECRPVICSGLDGEDECRVCQDDEECCATTNSSSEWTETWEQCSTSCGIGIKSLVVSCVDVDSGEQIDDNLCDKSSKPKGRKQECVHECDYRWRTSDWSQCDCGPGVRQRAVECIDHTRESSTALPDSLCGEEKPITTEICNNIECPVWIVDEWTPCSTTCGHGIQYRLVTCSQNRPLECPEYEKPRSSRPCEVDIGCALSKAEDYPNDEPWNNNDDPFADLELIGVPEEVQNMGISTIPRFITSDWGECSVTCGQGEITRSVKCQAYMPFQHRIKDMKDQECAGTKPYSYAKCERADCGKSPDANVLIEGDLENDGLLLEASDDDPASNAIDASIWEGITAPATTTTTEYSWDNSEYGECSKSCMKGFQESIIACKNTSGHALGPKLCPTREKPRSHIRECNNVPCPPRWKVGDFNPCSAFCGGGYQDRKLYCVQDFEEGKTERIPDYKCPLDMPSSIRICNSKFCPAHWVYGAWSKCSVTCGMGVQTREVYCVEKPLSNKVVNVSDLNCVDAKPPTIRHCTKKQCFKNWDKHPEIKSRNETFIQIKRVKKVHLYVGGSAYLLPRQYVKIRCPVRNIDKKLLFWTKDNRLVPTIGRVRVSRYGVLKITRTDPEKDKGVYTCLAEEQRSGIKLNFSNKKKARKIADNVIKRIDYSENIVDKYKKNNLSIADTGLVRDIATINTFQTVYTSSDWTPCPDSCGPGHQTRVASCVILTGDYMKYVSEKYCKRRNLKRPVLVKKCLEERKCPLWQIGIWSNCSAQHCSKEGYGTQWRDVDCFFKNGTITKRRHCARQKRPEHKRMCKNFECEAILYMGKWSKCRPRCGSAMVKSRILTCVWKSSKKPAYGGCQGVHYPVTHKPCKPTQCKSVCEDRSRFCNTVRLLNMCRYGNFNKNCCASCRYQRNSSKYTT